MGADFVEEELLDLIDPVLAELQQRRAECDDEMARCISLILAEFWGSHPTLKNADELSLSLDTMRTWLERRAKGGSIQ